MSLFSKKQEETAPTAEQLAELANLRKDRDHERAVILAMTRSRGLTAEDAEAMVCAEEKRQVAIGLYKIERERQRLQEIENLKLLDEYVVSLINEGVIVIAIQGRRLDKVKALDDIRCPDCGYVFGRSDFQSWARDIANNLKYSASMKTAPMNRLIVYGRSEGGPCAGVAAMSIGGCPACNFHDVKTLQFAAQVVLV